MAYTVLARKYRPQIFREMVGQEHVLKALINALDHDRLHHAYLFTGTRGVGKTTVARVLAKCFNCDQGVSSEPCGVCSACQEIAEGRSVDLIEVDAASRTKVEDTRELLENVQYAPSRSRYKIYLIDEVHMLSSHSFNALLKTLEEPPEHAKFLLATTDPQKLPATILSRCLQFHLKNLSPDRISDYLGHVLEREMIQADPAALAELGRAAEGSMRDALSLTDQAIAFGGGQVRTADVSSMLGSIASGKVLPLLQALQAGQAKDMLDAVSLLAEHGADFGKVVDMLQQWLHQIALAQWVPGTLQHAALDAEAIQALAHVMAPEDVQLFYQMLASGRVDVVSSSDPKAAFEMLLLRLMAFRPAIAFSDESVSFEVTAAQTSDSGVVSVAHDIPEQVSTAQIQSAGNHEDSDTNLVSDSSLAPAPWDDQPVAHLQDSAPPWGEATAPDHGDALTSAAVEPNVQSVPSAEPAILEDPSPKKSEAEAPLESVEVAFQLAVDTWPSEFTRLGLSGILY
ncbi:DNA polymerase III subunit gamma/tau, partial [Aequoribacter sp.]|uniref:DNA polymerase III subunit gamma/tau n=1 Tax=Aequoribacter sp. TaxID=2847771 RepID=UPI003F6967D1